MLGSSLQAKVLIEANEDTFKVLQNVNLPEIFICSDVQMDLNKNLSETKIKVKVDLASGGKCMRCWKVVPEVKDGSKSNLKKNPRKRVFFCLNFLTLFYSWWMKS